jgi:hypothetical protein
METILGRTNTWDEKTVPESYRGFLVRKNTFEDSQFLQISSGSSTPNEEPEQRAPGCLPYPQ